MSLVVPTWFKQRQGRAEPAGDNCYRLTAPNLNEAVIGIRQNGNGLWSAVVQQATDGPDLDATSAVFERPAEAWEAAFELYRRRFVI